MKLINKEQIGNKTILTTETPRFLRKPAIRKFMATKEYPTGYWNWLEMPDLILVPTSLSFQLDAWNRL